MTDQKDLKYDAQARADELALERYGCEFDELFQQQQADLYKEAYQFEIERLIGAAELYYGER